MPFENPKFKSSKAFDLIHEGLKDQAERENAIQAAKAIFAITLTSDDGETQSWHLDFKNKGCVGNGTAPEGQKADVTLVLSDKDFAGLVTGTTNAQRLFMGGKLKVRGNAMRAMKLEPILKRAQGENKAKL